MMTHPLMVSDINERDRNALDQRFQLVTWILFLVMTGALWLIPNIVLPHGLWLLGTGFILLGLNVVRALNDIETSGFTLVLGLLGISVGLGTLLGVNVFLLPFLMLVAGALIVWRVVRAQ